MSAEQLGRRLLEEVEEESLDEILAEIRASQPELHKSKLGIPALEQFLDLLRKPQQAASIPAWASSSQTSVENEDQLYDEYSVTPRPDVHVYTQVARPKSNVVQLTSSRSASGKTSLLYYLTALSVVPKVHSGNETAVVWLDTDGRFSAIRLAEITINFLCIPESKAEPLPLVKDALSHVHLFRLRSSAQLLETLKTLPEYLLSRDRHHSQQRALGLLILDSATAFYWQDRADAEVARLTNPGAPVPPFTATQIITELKKLEKAFECTVCFTSDASLQRKPGSRQSGQTRTVADSPLSVASEQGLHDQWTNFATLTMNIQRIPVPQFAPAMTIEECARDQPNRIQAVRKGRHRSQIIWTGNESNEAKDGIRSLENGEGLTFRITSQGVIID